jgi:hypothetical protein
VTANAEYLTGRGTDYWGQYEHTIIVEVFALIGVVSIANPNDLTVIKTYFENTYKVYEDMINRILKDLDEISSNKNRN